MLEVADDGRERLVDEYGEEFADAIITNIEAVEPLSPDDEPPLDDRSFVSAVNLGYYRRHPFDPDLMRRFEGDLATRRLVGERYLTIRRIGERDYEKLIERPMVKVPS